MHLIYHVQTYSLALLSSEMEESLCGVSIVAVSEGPHLDASLSWLQWHGMACTVFLKMERPVNLIITLFLYVGIVEVRGA